MIITMLEAVVDHDRTHLLEDEFRRATADLPEDILESFLLRGTEGGTWRIVTVWSSAAALQAMRRTAEVPEGVRMFRSAGAEPTLSIFEVPVHASHVDGMPKQRG